MADADLGAGFLDLFRIPDYIVDPDSPVEAPKSYPLCPVIVFVNSRSGGQLGGHLLATYRGLLSGAQIFDLGEEAPDKVLHRVYGNLERLKSSGDDLAAKMYDSLRLIVAGGDGTAGWLLGVVCDMKLAKPPPIAFVPLGTENNLPFSLGWGKKNPNTDADSVKLFLKQVLESRGMKIDSWHIIMRMKPPERTSCDPLAPLELPHSLHAFHPISSTDKSNQIQQQDKGKTKLVSAPSIIRKEEAHNRKPRNMKEGYHTFRGGFWNYFSIGLDAQIAFHSERKLYPEKFKNQIVNQTASARLGGTQGWVSASLFHPESRNIADLAKIKIMKKWGAWQDLNILSSIRSIVCLNLPSFSGGLNPWGTPNKKEELDRDITAPFVDDGLLEVVGFRDAWRGLDLLAPNGHGTRLAQARRIRFEFHKGAADHTFMRIDGEPWKQPLPADDEIVVVELSHLGQVNILATKDSISRSMYDPMPHSGSDQGDDVDSEDKDKDLDTTDARRKFGAADTFRYPKDIDVSHIS